MIRTEHRRMMEKVAKFAESDHRLMGAAIGGSYLTNELDQYSDLDFILVAKEDRYQDVMRQRFEIVKQFGEPLSAFTGEHVGEPRLIIALYDDPILHVDVKFITLSALEERVEDPVILFEKDHCITQALSKSAANYPLPDLQWIEDRFWIWTHYAATKIGRQELFETIDFLSFLRQTVLAPLISMKCGKLPRGVRKFEKETPSYVGALEKTVAAHDVGSCVRALQATIELYRELRDDHAKEGFVRHEQAERKATAYFEQVRTGNI